MGYVILTLATGLETWICWIYAQGTPNLATSFLPLIMMGLLWIINFSINVLTLCDLKYPMNIKGKVCQAATKEPFKSPSKFPKYW